MDSVGSPEEEYIYFVQEAPEGRFLVVERRWENRRLRILTKEQIEGMSAGGFHRYRKKFIELFVDGVNMKNPEAIRAFDYLRHTLAREHRRRDDESFMDRWERARSAEWKARQAEMKAESKRKRREKWEQKHPSR